LNIVRLTMKFAGAAFDACHRKQVAHKPIQTVCSINGSEESQKLLVRHSSIIDQALYFHLLVKVQGLKV
jgi:hypothetical protein